MSLEQLKKDIKNKEFNNIYLFYGDEEYVKNEYVKKVEKLIVDDQFLDFNKIIFEGKIDQNKVIDACDTLPVFADKKLVIVKSSGLFKSTKSNDDISENKLAKGSGLIEYLKSIPSQTVIIFVENEIDKRLKLVNTIKKNGIVVEFAFRNEDELGAWIASYLAKSNKKISRDSVLLIIEYLDQGIQQMIHEIDKLIGYMGERDVVTSDDIKMVCTRCIKSRIFDLIDSVSTNNGKRSVQLFEEMISLKEPIQKIFVMIAKQFRNMLFAVELQRESVSPKDIASKLGLMPFIVNKLIKHAKSFGSKKLKDLVEETYELDVKVKNGLIDSKIATEILIAKAVDSCK